MQKKLKLSSDGANEAMAMVMPMVGIGGICVWLESGVRQSVLCWCIWQESGVSHHEDVFTFNLLHNEILHILYFQCNLQR
jgi:hypothetical protein